MLVCLLILLTIQLHPCLSKCPHSCSGHGICGVANQCTCFPGWNGGAADCSTRNCPTGAAWADKAYSTDMAHQPTECSNAGECDRFSGVCNCFPGFTGSACQRIACPNECSGHGICSSLKDISLYLGPDYDSKTERAGDGLGIAYLNWDSDGIQVCECDSGYFGADCSSGESSSQHLPTFNVYFTSVMCPKGDDPLTINQNFRAIQLDIFAGAPLKGKIGLEFQGTKVYVPYNGLTSQSCSDILSFSGKFGLVGCNYIVRGGYHITLDLTFFNWPLYPKDNNMFSNTGNPSIYDFFCDITYSNPSTYCEFSDIVATNIIEYAYCSNRGNCDYSVGTCSCYDGFGGPACSNATFLYQEDSVTSPGLLVNVKATNFTSSVLQIQSSKSPASDFYLIEASANSNTMFFVRGDGVVGINKLKTLSGGQTIGGGGLFVEEGGTTIAESGLSVYSSDSVNPVVQIGSKSGGSLSSSYTALEISSVSPYSNNFYHINSLNRGKSRFSVRADGAVFVRGGGVQVTSGVTILSSGLSVTGGVTISDVGLVILQNGLVATGGLTINSNGVKILNGGLQLYGGMSIYSGGVKVASGITITSGGLSVTNGLTVSNNGVIVSGGLTIFNAGLTVTGGVTILNSGIRAMLGGLSIYNGGASISGGLTVGNGLVVTGGIQSANGLSIGSSFYASSTAVTVASGGLVIQGGISATSGPVSFGNGLTVENYGIVVSGGLTVTNSLFQAGSGVRVTGGLSVLTNGLFSTNGATLLSNSHINALTVASNSLFSSGMVSFNGGVFISGGLTVQGTVQMQYSPVVYSDRRLKTNLAPITNALEKVSKLRGVYYDWIQNEPHGMAFDMDRHIGIIAQEVRKVVPEVVHPSKENDYLTVDYNAIIPVLIEAIHEMENIILDFKQNQLKAELNAKLFKSELQQLKKVIGSFNGTSIS